MLKKFLIIITFIFLSLPGKTLAFKPETFVTFANPVRGPENWQAGKQDPLALPMLQYAESTSSAYPITWLLRYDAVRDATMSAFFNNLSTSDKTQTLGAFLEITPKLSAEANVSYPKGTTPFNANRIFLSGYSIDNRENLIDTYMAAFFVEYGYYPKSVSAWNLDSYSLQYLQSRYSVLTAMNCDDQYTTDNYRIWGGYLGSPYFPDKNNSLIPAKSADERVNLAMVRWAQRDLFNFYGYRSESSYSVQVNDYLAQGQNTKYFEKLLGLYSQRNLNEFTYINIGLENDYGLIEYKAEIKNVFKALKVNEEKFNLHFISLSDFGDWFKARYPESTPAYYYETTDPLESREGKVFWYQSPWYRIGFKSEKGITKIIDFRVYNREIYEDYFATPNQELSLYQEIPAVIDSVKTPGTEVILDLDLEKAELVHSKQWDYWQIAFKSGDEIVTLEPERIVFSGVSAPTISSKDIKVISKKKTTTWELTPYTPFKNSSKFTWLFWLLASLIVVILAKAGIHPKSRPPTSSLRDSVDRTEAISSTKQSVISKKNSSNATKSSVILAKEFTLLGGGIHPNTRTLIISILISLLATLTVFRNGLLYPFGMGFWGPNGHDAIFHLSLIEKFAASPFSFLHPQIAGERIANYHFIFDFLSGLVVKLFGISSLDLYFRVFPVAAGITIVLLLNKLLISWKYNRQERLLAIFLAFLAGSFGFIPKLLTGQNFFTGESAFWANQSVSIFLNPPYALSLILLLIFLNRITSHSRPERVADTRRGKSIQDSSKFSPVIPAKAGIHQIIPLIILGALLAQTKIYAFILLLGALLFSKKYKLFFGVLVLGVLISLPFTAFGGPSPFLFSPLWFPRSLFASFDRFYWPQIVQAWQAYEASGNFIKLALVNLFALTVFLIGNLGMRFLGLIRIAKTKAPNDSETIVRWVIFFGLIIPLLFVQNINPWNTIQFMYYSLFFLAIFTAKYISSLFTEKTVILANEGRWSPKGEIHKLPHLVIPGLTRNLYKSSIFLVFILFATLTSIGTLKDYIGFFSSSRIGYTELLALDKFRDQPRGIVLAPFYSQPKASTIYAPKPLYSYVSTAYISAISGQPEFLADTINLDITGFDYTDRARDVQRFYITEDKLWANDFLSNNHIEYVYETPLQKIKLAPEDLKLKKIFDSGEINVYVRAL